MHRKPIFFKALLFTLLLIGVSSALEVRPFAGVLAPAETDIIRDERGVKTERSQNTDLMFQGGIELLTWSKFNPFRYGVGLGGNTKQKDGSLTVAPAGIPVWLSFAFGSVNKFQLFSPYAAFRAGYVFPFSTKDAWWERPKNFTINGGLGCIFPYGIGLEINYNYISMLKSYEHRHQAFRTSSGRFGVQLSIGIELTYDRKERQETYEQTVRESDEAETVVNVPVADSTKAIQDTSKQEATVADTAKQTTAPAQESKPEQAPAQEVAPAPEAEQDAEQDSEQQEAEPQEADQQEEESQEAVQQEAPPSETAETKAIPETKAASKGKQKKATGKSSSKKKKKKK